MRQYLWRLEVRTDSSGKPTALHYRNRWWRVSKLIDSFRFGGRWWLGEAPRTYYLVDLEGRLDMEIYCEIAPSEDDSRATPGVTEAIWVLTRVQD